MSIRVGFRAALALAAVTCWLLDAQVGVASGPVDISPQNQWAGGAHLAVDPAGDAVAVWALGTNPNNQGGTDSVQAAIRPAGGAFGAPVTVSSPGEYGFQARVAMDQAGDTVVVWVRFVAAGNYVMRAAFRPWGGSFGPPVDISGPLPQSPFPELAMNSAGEAVAEWTQANGSSASIEQAAIRPAGGGSWQPPANLSDPTKESADVVSDVAIDQAGDALVVWTSNIQDVRGAYRPAGQAFGPAFDIGTGIQPQASMDTAGDATVVWGGSDGVLHGRTGRGTSFGPQFDLSGQQAGEYALAGNAAGDTVASSTGMNGSVMHAVFTPAGGGQPSPQDLENNGIFAGSSQDGGPAAALDPAGNATVVWYHSNPGYRSIRAAFRPSGGSFGSPFDLSRPGVDATGAQVAADQGGNVIYVWERTDPKTGIETVQALLPASPPPSPPPPGTGGVGPIGGIPGPPSGGGVVPPHPPLLRLLRLTPGTFSTAGRIAHGHCVASTPANRALRSCTRPVSLRVSFDATRAGTVTLTVQQAALGGLARVRCVAPSARNRRARRCTRLITLRGRVTRQVHAGKNSFVYVRAGLSPGSYRLLATPSLKGRPGKAVSTTFRVIG